jgi:hypothetical protein
MRNYLCLVAVFKNEAHILEEWLDHYTREGVDKFFLLNNGSTDDYFSKLRGYPVDMVVDSSKYIQESGINKCFLEKIKSYDWVIVCDLDEFIYARKEFKTIPDYLKTLEENVSQISLEWKLFGSSGYNTLDKKQPELVVPNFIYRWKELPFRGDIMSKTITRTNQIIKLHPHNPSFREGEKILTDDVHINHYRIQSLDWFSRVKAHRGDVSTPRWEHTRKGRNYFIEHDKNDVEDRELADKYKSI